jgi:hypothetical protein
MQKKWYSLQANFGCHMGGKFGFERGKKHTILRGEWGRISPNILVKKKHCVYISFLNISVESLIKML